MKWKTCLIELTQPRSPLEHVHTNGGVRRLMLQVMPKIGMVTNCDKETQRD